MAVVNEVVTKFSFTGDLKPQKDFNTGLTSSIKLLAGMAAGVTAAAGAMFAWAGSVFNTIDPMVQLSRETGVALESIQELGYAASVNGSSLDAVSASVREMTKRIGEFEQMGGGPAKEVVEKLGISFRDANGQIKSADQVMMDLTDTMQGMTEAERMNVLDKLGIDPSMIQLLSLTGDEIGSLRERAQRLGVVTKEQGDAVAAYNDSLTTLRFGMQGVQNMVAVGFAPAMTSLVDSFVGVLEANQDWIVGGLTWLGEVITSTMGLLQRMWLVFAGIAAGFLIAKIAAVGFGTVMGVILSPVVLITGAIAAVILIIDDLIVAMKGGESVIVDFFQSFFGIDIVPALQAVVDAVSWLIGKIIDLFSPLVDAIGSVFKAIAAVFTGDFEGALGHLSDAFSSWIEFVKGLFSALLDGIKGMWGSVLNFIKNLAMDLLPDWAIKLLGGAADVASTAVGAVSDTASAVGGAVSGAASAVGGYATEAAGAVADKASAAWDWATGWMGRDEAVSMNTTQVTDNSRVEQQVQVNISTNDPQRAGAAVTDSLQRQMQDARTMSNKGGL